jgi:16S rRNA (cytosine1402-N4)-methyltransferase
MPTHLPVLLTETLDLLQPERGGVFVDGTLGLGGHAEALLNRAEGAGATVRLIGIDKDPYALELAEERLGERVQYLQGTFAEIERLRTKKIIQAADGILLDIGVSSYQIDTPERGFSFQQEGPLDMRMDQDGGVTAKSIIASWPERRLAQLFTDYGEERLAAKIAAAIVAERKVRPITTTTQLAALISAQYHPSQRYKRPHPATRVFQALRIEVNQELPELETAIPQALALLAPGGVLAVITFHSLEDRIVKYAFRAAAESPEFTLLTKKPIMPGRVEQVANPRSRSAKLRGIQRIR